MDNKDENDELIAQMEKMNLKKKGKVNWTDDTKNNNYNNDDIYHKRQKTPIKHKDKNLIDE